jgi:putative tryptophan/tyrosine transport system substrate-binding protein
MPCDHRLTLDRRRMLQGSLGLAGLGLLAGCGLAPARSLWGPGPRRIGVLLPGGSTSAAENYAAFRAGLAELGYVEGQGVVLEARYADGKIAALPALAAELVALPVDVILTDGTTAIGPALQATRTIPIVAANAIDPVADGFVASMARPGGNLTGLTSLLVDEEAKRLQLLKEVAPSMTRVAVLWPSPQAVRFRQIENAAPSLGLQVLSLILDRPDDFEVSMTTAIAGHADGFIVIGAAGIYGPLVPRIVEVAAQNRWPSMSATPSFARVGGLLGVGAHVPDLYRRAAIYVDKILKGANPAEMPIERASKIEFVLNLRTAQAIGLTIPPSVFQQATEIIQ